MAASALSLAARRLATVSTVSAVAASTSAAAATTKMVATRALSTFRTDHFSHASANYANFRPSYPGDLYDKLLDFHCGARDMCVDIGCGNGQATRHLANKFRRVIGVDPSKAQLEAAMKAPNIQYVHAPAEHTKLEGMCADVVTVAQAFHWFDFPAFFEEATRILKPDGTLAVWGYGTNHLVKCKEADEIFQKFYWDIRDYFPSERRFVDGRYEDIDFPFPVHRESVDMIKRMSLEHFMGYVGTWSGVKKYIDSVGQDPLPALHEQLLRAYQRQNKNDNNNPEVIVNWPVFLIMSKPKEVYAAYGCK